MAGSNLEAVEVLIETLQNANALTDLDTARVESARTLARQLDADPGASALWAQYRFITDLLRASMSQVEDRSIDRLLAELGDPQYPDTSGGK